MKTDRIDAAELAELYANGLLTVVAPPDAEVEQDRDLLRSRQRLIQQLFIEDEGRPATAYSVTAAAQRVALQGRVRQQDALEDTTLSFAIWGCLERTIADCTGSLKVNLSLVFRQLNNLDEILAAYGVEVEALAVTPRYEEPVKALTCC